MGASDAFIGPCEDIPVENEEWGIDFEAEVAVITDDMRTKLKPGASIVVRGYNAKDKSCEPACRMNARDVTFPADPAPN